CHRIMPFICLARMIGRGRGASRAMTTPKTKLHRNRSFVAIVTLFASLAALLTLVPPQTASALDPLNPFNTFTDSGPVTPEEREQREQLRADLYDRLSPAYRIDMPFVSDASITALQQAIERYRQIVAAGGWPVTADKVTLRPGDTSSEI